MAKDAFAVRHFVSRGFEMLCAQSFSKIFGLYGERAGNLTLVHNDPTTMKSVMVQLTTIAFDTYLTPPRHGSSIVQAILNDATLFDEWLENLRVMPRRLKSMRQKLYDELIRINTPGSWLHIIDQIGMFSYTGLNGWQLSLFVYALSVSKEFNFYFILQKNKWNS